ncbi:ATP synthase subunit I [uncultured Cocleimonas sp.]|uniref:ATP synthase subunit I n=1 Tax=uncultured Cocleimonas sp. TaxID=1051587 RepID=UPI00261C775B|nr:ATP synthase subunit I [uncultured Cocleimonas sp.]
MKNLLVIQAILVVLGVAVSFFYLAEEGILPAAYGGAVAIANTILLSRRLDSAGEMAKENPEGGVLTLYLGVIQRFVFVLVMFGVGMGVLKLLPPPMLGTFAVAQLAFMLFGSKQTKLASEEIANAAKDASDNSDK